MVDMMFKVKGNCFQEVLVRELINKWQYLVVKYGKVCYLVIYLLYVFNTV